MAGFCGNCGAPLEEGAKVCGHCGTPIVAENVRILKGIADDRKMREKAGKGIRKILFLAVMLIVCIVMVNLISNFVGKKGLVNRVMRAYVDYDVDTLISVSSDIYSYGTESTTEILFRNMVGTDLDSYEETAGHDYQIDYEINDIYEVSKRKKEEVLEQWESTYPDYDIGALSEIAIAEVTLDIEGEQIFSTMLELYLVKENGTWKLLYIE